MEVAKVAPGRDDLQHFDDLTGQGCKLPPLEPHPAVEDEDPHQLVGKRPGLFHRVALGDDDANAEGTRQGFDGPAIELQLLVGQDESDKTIQKAVDLVDDLKL